MRTVEPTSSERVLILAPRGRDAVVAGDILTKAGLVSEIVSSITELLSRLSEGAGAALITDEAMHAEESQALGDWLAAQPVWSDMPIVRLTTRPLPDIRSPRGSYFDDFGNVIILERPLSARTLISACQAAVRQRRRQYATRANLQQLDDARREVQRVNTELELRIRSRTRQLAEANDRLTAEIGQRERTQSALSQAQKMEALGRLTGGIAHDFNNVLHAVSMNLEILERLNTEPRALAVAKRAIAASHRGATLTSQLLTFARNQSLLPQETDVSALLRGMRELLSVSLGPSISLDVDVPERPMWVMVDSTQLEMAMLNLAVNAKDAMPDGGALTVAAQAAAGDLEVVIQVRDTGHGMPSELLERVFEPFFTTKPIGQGTGLGLSQVYGFALQSGGRAQISSVPDTGTVVEIHLPLIAHTALPVTALDAGALAQAVESVPTSRRVLVVEDDQDVRRVMMDSLRLLSHEPVEATSGAEALGVLEHESFDLLLVDYSMPGMNGAELIRHVRDRFGYVPAILATGYADMAEVGKVLYAQSVLLKPFSFQELSKVLSSVRYSDPDGAVPRASRDNRDNHEAAAG